MHPAVKIGDDNKLLPKTMAFRDPTKWGVDMLIRWLKIIMSMQLLEDGL